LYNNNGTNIVARAAWELGESAVVSGLYRTDDGVVYYDITNPLGVGTSGIPASGEGLAVLFAGKKFDKTLLAVGVLNSIDGVPIATNNRISTTTNKVSFNLNVIRSGIGGGAATNRFQTAPAQTSITTLRIGDRDFPFFLVERASGGAARTITATYTFSFNSAAPDGTVPNFNFYSRAIRVAGAATAENVMPKYTQPPNLRPPFEKNANDSRFSYDGSIVIGANVTATGTPFTGVVNFSFSTGLRDDTIFAIIFRVPVYAVVDGGVDWYFRPDYNEYFRELDGNDAGKGGAVLIGVDIVGNMNKGLVVDYSGAKNYIGVHPDDYHFTLDGVLIFFVNGDDRQNLLGTITNDWWTYYPTLKFYWDGGRGDNVADTLLGTNTTPAPGFTFDDDDRRIVIRVEYYDGNDTYDARMEVEVYRSMGYIDIPMDNRFIIVKQNDFTEFTNRLAADQTYLLALAESVNIPTQSFNELGNLRLFIVGIRPNLEFGRDNGTAQISSANGTNCTVYLGKWPFNEPSFAGGNVIHPEFFSVNAAGRAGGGDDATNSFFTTNGGTMAVEVLTGITIRFPARLGPP